MVMVVYQYTIITVKLSSGKYRMTIMYTTYIIRTDKHAATIIILFRINTNTNLSNGFF